MSLCFLKSFRICFSIFLSTLECIIVPSLLTIIAWRAVGKSFNVSLTMFFTLMSIFDTKLVREISVDRRI